MYWREGTRMTDTVRLETQENEGFTRSKKTVTDRREIDKDLTCTASDTEMFLSMT